MCQDQEIYLLDLDVSLRPRGWGPNRLVQLEKGLTRILETRFAVRSVDV